MSIGDQLLTVEAACTPGAGDKQNLLQRAGKSSRDGRLELSGLEDAMRRWSSARHLPSPPLRSSPVTLIDGI